MTREQHELLAAADDNFAVHVSYVPSRVPGMRVVADGKLTLVDSGLNDDTFNIVCRARMAEAEARARIRAAIRHFRDAGRPFSWWVSPVDRPADLAQRLVDAGLKRTETHVAMASDLSSLAAAAEVVVPPGVRIERVQTAQHVRDFAGADPGFSNPLLDSTDTRFFTAAEPALLSPASPIRLYVAYAGDEPVATSEVTLAGGVAGIYNVSTKVAHRRRGIGTAMTLRPLLDARAAGVRTAILQASQEGLRVYQRLGFARIGEINEYK